MTGQNDNLERRWSKTRKNLEAADQISAMPRTPTAGQVDDA